MKVSELIDKLQNAMNEHGDIDVCVPDNDETIDGHLVMGLETKVRPYGVQQADLDATTRLYWIEDERAVRDGSELRSVFVICG